MTTEIRMMMMMVIAIVRMKKIAMEVGIVKRQARRVKMNKARLMKASTVKVMNRVKVRTVKMQHLRPVKVRPVRTMNRVKVRPAV